MRDAGIYAGAGGVDNEGRRSRLRFPPAPFFPMSRPVTYRSPFIIAETIKRMITKLFAAAVGCLFVLVAGRAAQAEEIALTQAGKPRAAIIVAPSIKPHDFSAKAIAAHVEQMSGAKLPIVLEQNLTNAKVENGRLIVPPGKVAAGKSGPIDLDADQFILIGEGELSKKLGVDAEGLGPGGIRVKTVGNTAVLLAKFDGLDNSRYPVHARAAVRLLEELGCRYLWPGETGKVVPKQPTIGLKPLDVTFTPPIGQRNIRFNGYAPRGHAEGSQYLGFTADNYRDFRAAAFKTVSEYDWGAWNGLGGNLGIAGGHSGTGLHGGWDEFGTAHPEWFALQPDGTRDQSKAGGRWQLCVSNPQLVEHVAADIIKRLGGKPQPALSLSPNDGGYSNFCMCDECKKLDAPNGPKIRMLVFDKVGESNRHEIDYVSLTDRYVHYWNAIAERVTKEVPDQLFVIDAYSYYSDPPVRERPHPNLVVRYVPNETAGWQGWLNAGAKRGYWRPNNVHGGYREGAVKPTGRSTAEKVRFFATHGALATDMDGIYDNWATQGIEYYVAARLSYDPSLTFDELLADYCRTGFGAGAESMRQYFLLVETGVTPVVIANRGHFPKIEPATIDKMREHLVTAAKATADDGPSRRRVDFMRAGFELTAISAEAHRLKNAVAAGEAIDTAAAHAVLERRWQLMRAMFERQPLTVNVAVVAVHDRQLNEPLKWKGPTDAARGGKFTLPAGDDWLNEDQSATRRGAGEVSKPK
jgi:hypothetical protein